MPLAHLACLATQIGEGLAAAAAAIVHLDIKPQSIFLAGDITESHPPIHCKTLDFGVARAMGAGTTITKGSSLLGTPAYMAPEQAKGEAVDHRSDLHSLPNSHSLSSWDRSISVCWRHADGSDAQRNPRTSGSGFSKWSTSELRRPLCQGLCQESR
ncbi:MAG: protein kinase [Myxococcales bacterium]|nr:protein kinase [Myxococcales bacterium]